MFIDGYISFRNNFLKEKHVYIYEGFSLRHLIAVFYLDPLRYFSVSQMV